MHKLRVVVDTNVVVSAAASADAAPAAAINWISRNGVFLSSDATLFELRDVLSRSRLARYINPDQAEYLIGLIRTGVRVAITETITECADEKDNKFLELAVSGRADCIVSGDKKHLLPMHPFRSIPILSPVDFLIGVAGRAH